MTALRSGACTPWAQASDIEAMPWVQEAVAALTEDGELNAGQLTAICAQAATAASDILYQLSGKVYTGVCGPVKVRPEAHRAQDGRPLVSPSGLDGYYAYGWGARWRRGSNPPEVDLGVYPVTAIVAVKIDGVTIPSTEYELRDHRVLIRIRPTASSTPTDRWGWPTSQVQDLPDTQQGTFSIEYTYGQAPPAAGELAAKKLAEMLVLPQLGDDTHYPTRITSMARQGVTAMVTDVMDLVMKGGTGIYEVEIFLNSVNPGRNQRQAAVWSPDLGRPRRTATP